MTNSPSLRRARHNDERGFSTSVQLTLLFPTLFLTILLALQWALHFWGTSVAKAAAQDGARVAASYQATTDEGVAAAEMAITTSAVTNVHISGQRTSTTASITVTGQSLSVVPGWSPTIEVTSAMPLERVIR